MATSDVNEALRAAGVTETANVSGLLAALAVQVGGERYETSGAIESLASQLAQLRAVAQAQAEAVSANTNAVTQNTVARASSVGSAAATAGKSALKFLGSGLGLSPVISGIIGLFTGDKAPEPPPLVPYIPPPPVAIEGRITRGAVSSPAGGDSISPPYGLPDTNSGGRTQAPQITVQVQAIDSRSFMDHSDAIARAVREAMLRSHSLNDVVNDL